MLKGRLTLGGFTLEFGQAADRFERLSQEARELEERLDALMIEEREALEALSRIYLPDLSTTSICGALVEARGELQRMRIEHESRRGSLEEEVRQASSRVEEWAAALRQAEEELAGVERQVDAARERVVAALRADPDHADRVAEHDAVMAFRELLKRRRARLVAASSVERVRYDDDAVFRYLEDRDYGGPSYEAGLLASMLDRWLARRVGFATLQRNYRILKVGPHQIQSAIRGLEERAASLESELDARDASEAEAQGLVGFLRTRGEAARAVEEARATHGTVVAEEAILLREQREVEFDRGQTWTEALAMHRRHLRSRAVTELESLARATPEAEDDALVRSINRIRSEIAGLDGRLRNCLGELRTASGRADRMAELEGAGVARFRSTASDRPEDPREVRSAFEAFLNGEVDADRVVAALDGATRPVILDVPEPYFEQLYGELAAAFDEGRDPRFSVVEVEDEKGHEITVRSVDGRVIGRRVTRRAFGPGTLPS